MVDVTFKKSILNSMPYYMANELRLLKNKYNSRLSFDQMEIISDRMYYMHNGRHINWDNPMLYTEKVNFSKIYCADELKTKLTDKITVRNWVEQKIGTGYIIPIYGVYEKFSDVSLNELPDSFVLKCNHDSGSTRIVSDKNSLTKSEIKKVEKLYDNYLLKKNHGYISFEMQYVNIRPRLIVEKSLGDCIRDYKFMCFGGTPYYCWVDIDRFSNHKRNVYDLDWNLQPFNQTFDSYKGYIEKPEAFDEMVDIARKLSEGFDHVRVDLYNCNGKIYFGEMTFTNGSGLEVITPPEWDKKLGDLWELDLRCRCEKKR